MTSARIWGRAIAVKREVGGDGIESPISPGVLLVPRIEMLMGGDGIEPPTSCL